MIEIMGSVCFCWLGTITNFFGKKRKESSSSSAFLLPPLFYEPDFWKVWDRGLDFLLVGCLAFPFPFVTCEGRPASTGMKTEL